MILVDTSIWVPFFAGRTPYVPELDRLLNRDEMAGHDLIHGELMIGDRGGRAEFSLVANVPLWTADERLAGLAGELGLSYTVRL